VNQRRRTIRNLVIFSVVVLVIGFIGRALDVGAGTPDGQEGPGLLLWLVAPTITGLLLRAFAGDGWADFGIRPRFRGNGKWYLFALLVYPVLTVAALAIGGGLGRISFPGFTVASLGLLVQAFALGALPQFVKNIFEEGAWRGYLAPRIFSLGLDNFAGHALTGLIWGAWHIPYYLFFLDRAILEQFTTLSVGAFIVSSIVVMMAWSTVFGELFLLTGSIWPAVLMHMVEDAFVNQLFTEGHIAIVPGSDWLVSPVNGLISVVLWLAMGVALYRYRKSREATASGLSMRAVTG
jgi:membrane protease YdiL (CAAX protease family)